MKAARSNIDGEIVEVPGRPRKAVGQVDPPALARHIVAMLRDAGLSTRNIARVVCELPSNHTAARRALASITEAEARDVRD